MRCRKELMKECGAAPRTCGLCGNGGCKVEQVEQIIEQVPLTGRKFWNEPVSYAPENIVPVKFNCACEGWHKQYCPNARRA